MSKHIWHFLVVLVNVFRHYLKPLTFVYEVCYNRYIQVNLSYEFLNNKKFLKEVTREYLGHYKNTVLDNRDLRNSLLLHQIGEEALPGGRRFGAF